ncbi:hypothetical protein ACF1BU_25555 [Streptomyces sp. NPDC014724]|uniref:hypothetical protein n=1 Tax=unclassified Streptomyces TaxID=2593676 RepID=UPI0036FBE024
MLGHLDCVRGDIIYDLGQAQKDENDWNKMMNYHIIGAPLAVVPIASDAIQLTVNVGTAAYMNELNAKVDAEARNNMINHYDDGERQMYAMLRKMAMEKGFKEPELDASPGEYEDHLQSIAVQWYQNGMGDADKWMGQ